MNLTTEQQRWLTEEFLGLCWHEKVSDGSNVWGPGYTPPMCSCGKTISGMTTSHANLDFTDWRTFGLLMNELDNRFSDEEIARFLYTLAVEGNIQSLPIRAAYYIYELSNGGQP